MVQTGLGRSTIFAAMKDGRLKKKKIGRRTVVLVDELRRFLEESPDGE